MTRNLSEITERDIKYRDLGRTILEIIPVGDKKEWSYFKKYMDFYYKDLPSHLDKTHKKWCKKSGSPCKKCKNI